MAQPRGVHLPFVHLPQSAQVSVRCLVGSPAPQNGRVLDCTYEHNKFTFNTGSTRSAATGMHYFTGGAKPIRSVMLGWTEGAELDEKKKKNTKIKIKRSCKLKKTKKRFDVNETVANLSYEADWVDEGASGGLSANWSDALPDLADASGSSA